MTGTSRAWLAWVPALAWAAMIFVLSSQSVLPSPAGLDDKQAHSVAYGVLALLCLVGLTGARWWRVSAGALLTAFVLTVLYGVSDEIHQSFVPGRSPDVADVIADARGAGLTLGAAWASAILLRRRSSASRS